MLPPRWLNERREDPGDRSDTQGHQQGSSKESRGEHEHESEEQIPI
jgi:hypothetical protein